MKPTFFPTGKKHRIGMTIAFIVTLIVYTNASAAAGVLDTTFGTGGKVITDFGDGYDGARSIAIQPDGKMITVGASESHNAFAVARYNVDGSLDTSFGTDGIVFISFLDSAGAGAVTIQNDGKIIVAGGTSVGEDSALALARLNIDGSLDMSFGTGGKATTNVGSVDDHIKAITIQPDGKIVAAGIIYVGPGGMGIFHFDFVVICYNADGSPDASFDADGIVTTSLGSEGVGGEVASVVIQPDGKIIVGGIYNSLYGNDFVAIRYNTNGSLDTGFDSDGVVVTDFEIASNSEWGGHIALQADGRIILAGNNSDDGYFLLVRYNNDGSLDTTFGTNGFVVTPANGDVDTGVKDVALQPNGKIILAGYSVFYDGNNDLVTNCVIIRYRNNGSLDTSFGTRARAVAGFGGMEDAIGDDAIGAVAIQTDGKIVVAGHKLIDGDNYAFAMERYIGDDPATAAATFTSIANNDGWTLESSEYSSRANARNDSGHLLVGDDAKNKQYRSLLYFDTSSLPDNAVISNATLRIMQADVSTTEMFFSHGLLFAEMKNGIFGRSPLENTDFQAVAHPKRSVGTFASVSEPGWYELMLNPANYKYVNPKGATQFRIRYTKDDDNDKIADFISFYSGDDSTNPPQLIIEYIMP
jgi:uncharacterized delta-60 repeat protein